MQRIYAHKIRYNGHTYDNHLLELNQETGSVTIEPFSEEVHSTVFRSGAIEVIIEIDKKNGLYRLTDRPVNLV